MLQYFIRRVLLAIPTFLLCTVVVFFIVQLAPGGPMEQQIQALRSAGSNGEGGGGKDAASAIITPTAMAELQRYYMMDKNVAHRYIIWLGLAPRPDPMYDVQVTLGEPKNAGNEQRIIVMKEGNSYVVRDPDKPGRPLKEGWVAEYQHVNDTTHILRATTYTYAGILTGYFGKSDRYQEPVLDLIAKRIPISIQFGIISIILTYVVCIYLGIAKALRHGSKFDVISSAIVFIAYSVPGWALGSVLLVVFSTESGLNILPLRGMESNDYADLQIGDQILDRLMHFVLPTIAYTISGFATITMLMKNSLLDNLSQDYVRTAFAKGIKEKRVIWLHAMRNSIIPLASRFGVLIGVFLSSSYLVEVVFGIEGLGKLSFQAILQRDYPIVFAFTVINVAVVLIGSIISDFVLALVDPRIKFK